MRGSGVLPPLGVPRPHPLRRSSGKGVGGDIPNPTHWSPGNPAAGRPFLPLPTSDAAPGGVPGMVPPPQNLALGVLLQALRASGGFGWVHGPPPYTPPLPSSARREQSYGSGLSPVGGGRCSPLPSFARLKQSLPKSCTKKTRAQYDWTPSDFNVKGLAQVFEVLPFVRTRTSVLSPCVCSICTHRPLNVLSGETSSDFDVVPLQFTEYCRSAIFGLRKRGTTTLAVACTDWQR